MELKDPSTRTIRFRDKEYLCPIIKRKLKNRSVITAQNTEGGFNLYFRKMDQETPEHPRCAQTVFKGKIVQTKISLSREALECLILNAIEVLSIVDNPTFDIFEYGFPVTKG